MYFFKKTNILAIIIQLVAVFILLLSALSCVRRPIQINSFPDYIEIKPGEDAKVEWDFKNADYVVMLSTDKKFGAKDFIFLSPQYPTLYTFKAVKENFDSVVQTCLVNVKQTVKESPRRGPTSTPPIKPVVSSVQSDYLNGVTEKGNLSQPVNLRIMRTIGPNDENKYQVHALLLDDFGNYLKGYTANDKVAWSVIHNSSKDTIKYEVYGFIQESNGESKLDLGIAIDVSSISENHKEIMDNIKEFLTYLDPNDNFMLSSFNHNFKIDLSITSVEKARWEINNINLSEPIGMSSVYKAGYKSILNLASGYNKNKALVIITFNSDNSSLVYTSTDVARVAMEKQVPVYIIGIGDAMESYELRYLCAMTGGRYYEIQKEELGNLKNILHEIAFAQKNYYQFDAELSEKMIENESIKAVVDFETNDSKIGDYTNIIVHPTTQSVKTQSIANFDLLKSVVKPIYEDLIKSIAGIMRDNPETKIEFIGHSGNEGDREENRTISLERADEVKNILVSFGISPDRVMTKGEGNSLPIYYLESTSWQQSYNRRVEVRWLVASILPFEIKAEVVNSEEEADSKSAQWEKRGYKAYYSRYIEDDKSVYKVKLWGYATLPEAQKAVAKLSKKYKQQFVIE